MRALNQCGPWAHGPMGPWAHGPMGHGNAMAGTSLVLPPSVDCRFFEKRTFSVFLNMQILKLVRIAQIWSDLVIRSSNIIKYHQISSNIIKYHIKYHQICIAFSEGSASVAYFQDSAFFISWACPSARPAQSLNLEPCRSPHNQIFKPIHIHTYTHTHSQSLSPHPWCGGIYIYIYI